MHIQEVKLAMEHNLKAQGGNILEFSLNGSGSGSVGRVNGGGINDFFKNQLKAETHKLSTTQEKAVSNAYEKPREPGASGSASEKNNTIAAHEKQLAKTENSENRVNGEKPLEKAASEKEKSQITQKKGDETEGRQTENAFNNALEAAGLTPISALLQTNIDEVAENEASEIGLLQNLFTEESGYTQSTSSYLAQTSLDDAQGDMEASDAGIDAFLERLSLAMEQDNTEIDEKKPLFEFVGIDANELAQEANNRLMQNSANGENELEANSDNGEAVANLIGNSDDSLINVIDERTISSESALKSAKLKDGEGFVEGVSSGNDNIALGNQAQGKFASDALNGQSAQKENKFSSLLSREIQNKAADFVKAGNIVLRDNNSGLIRLALNPEHLGSVKINLRLNGSEISANIAVASEEAFQAFKDSIASIKAAFSESGFGTGDFNLSWTGGGQDGAGENSKNREAFAGAAALTYVDSTPDSVQDTDTGAFYNTGVNMVA